MINANVKRVLASILGWLSLILLMGFFVNIAIGKYLHLQKISIVAPIHGVTEFQLFGVIIILFSACSLLKESVLMQEYKK